MRQQRSLGSAQTNWLLCVDTSFYSSWHALIIDTNIIRYLRTRSSNGVSLLETSSTSDTRLNFSILLKSSIIQTYILAQYADAIRNTVYIFKNKGNRRRIAFHQFFTADLKKTFKSTLLFSFPFWFFFYFENLFLKIDWFIKLKDQSY